MAATFHVAPSYIVKTAAERRLPSTDSVLTMLKWVERHVGRREIRQESDSGSGNHRRSSYSKNQNKSRVKMEMSYVHNNTTNNNNSTLDDPEQ